MTKIYLTAPFPISIKDTLTEKVIYVAKQTETLKSLSINYSYEGGFELPLTMEWKEKLKDVSILKYHSARQLRYFFEDGKVVGLRTKDSIEYWSDEELKLLNVLINDVMDYLTSDNEKYFVDRSVFFLRPYCTQQDNDSKKFLKLPISKLDEFKMNFMNELIKIQPYTSDSLEKDEIIYPKENKIDNTKYPRTIKIMIKDDFIVGLEFIQSNKKWTIDEVNNIILCAIKIILNYP